MRLPFELLDINTNKRRSNYGKENRFLLFWAPPWAPKCPQEPPKDPNKAHKTPTEPFEV